MLKSMTAFGRSQKKFSIGNVTVEVQSLNRKFLDVGISLPNELAALEIPLRRRVSSQINRGKVQVKVYLEYVENMPISVKPNLPLAKEIQKAWQAIGKELHLAMEVDFRLLAQMPDILQFHVEQEKSDSFEKVILETLDEAIDFARKMKEKEGRIIAEDFDRRFLKMSLLVEEIRGKSSLVKEKNREKLRQLLLSVMEEGSDFEERLLKEACLYAEKVDIAEEITRLLSHIDQFRGKMNQGDEPVGKTLEFLLQEMQREANTIGSKSQDLEIAQHVVELKTEIERVREQVQNVE